MKTFRKISVIIVGITGLLVITGIIISKIYEEEIGQYAIRELNEHITTPVSVEKIDLSLLRKFPDASIHFKEVFVPSVKGFDPEQFPGHNTDTLLFLDDVFFQFGLKSLFTHNYEVKEVHINRGKANLLIDSNGKSNYLFWKEPKQERDSNFVLNLQDVRITSVHLTQVNKAKNTELTGFVQRLMLNGDFRRKQYDLSERFSGRIEKFSVDNINYLKNSEIRSQATLSYNNGTYNLIKGIIGFDDLTFDVGGQIERTEAIYLDLMIEGTDLDAGSLLNHLPGSFQKVKKKISLTGIVVMTTKITGKIGTSDRPSVESRFNLDQGNITVISQDVNLNDVRLDAFYSNGSEKNPSTSMLSMENVSFRHLTSRFGGLITLSNFKYPDFNCSLKADFYLEHLADYFNTGSFEYLKGNVKTRMSISGKQKDFSEIKKQDLLNWNFEGTILLEDVNLKPADSQLGYHNISGTLYYYKYLKLNNLGVTIAGNNLIISGRVDNLIDRITHDHTSIWADLEIYSHGLTLDSLFVTGNEVSSPDSITDSRLPEQLYIKSRYWLDELKFKNFSAEHVRGDLAYSPGIVTFNSFQFSSMGGHVSGDGFYEQTDSLNYNLRLKSSVHRIDISELFYSCNNFGQSFIVDENLKGSLTGSIDYYSRFDKSHKLIKESILTESDVEIRNGELIHFEPMLSLSRFIEVEELEHITFSTLTNQIFIRNSAVVIPKMDIHSSAFNISGSGIHSFNNDFDYKVVVDLSEILAGKSRHSRDDQREFGIIEDDGLGRTKLYLSITGTPEDYDIGYDRKSAIRSVKERMTEEKSELKTILSEEFGLFKGDSTESHENTEDDKPDFILEWDEEEETSDRTFKKKDTSKRFILEWDDEDINEKDSTISEPTRRKRRKK